MKISIITLFPQIFESVLNTSIIGRAQKKEKVEFEYIDLRQFGEGPHQIVDGRPYGGGPGMVLRADILAKALNQCKVQGAKPACRQGRCKVVLTTASGKKYKETDAQRFSKTEHLVIICGHYEGVDQRFIDKYVDEEISIGDYVLTGGELPALVMIDTIVRLIPGVLKKEEATIDESFTDPNLLEYPQYTRPNNFEGEGIPEILLSGNHGEIEKWHKEKALEKTKRIRPDLTSNL